MDEEAIKRAGEVLAKARKRRGKDADDALRNNSEGNFMRMRQSSAYFNGVAEVLDALGIRRQVETESMRHGH